MPFNPEQPYEVESASGFDPSKPFEVVEEPATVSLRPAIPAPGEASPQLRQAPPIVPQAFPAVEQAKQETAKLPAPTAEELEQEVFEPRINLGRTQPEGTVSRAAENLIKGIPEFLSSAGGIYAPAIQATPAGPAMDLLMAGGMLKSGSQKIGEASVTGNRQTMAEGIGEVLLGGMAGVHPAVKGPLADLKAATEVPKPDVTAVDLAARKALSVRDSAGEVVSPQAVKTLPLSAGELNKLGGKDAVPIGKSEALPLENQPKAGAEVGARVPEPETPSVSQNVNQQQPQPAAEVLSPVRDLEGVIKNEEKGKEILQAQVAPEPLPPQPAPEGGAASGAPTIETPAGKVEPAGAVLESKPPPATPEAAPEVPAPVTAAVSEASKGAADTASLPSAISETKPAETVTQAAEPIRQGPGAKTYAPSSKPEPPESVEGTGLKNAIGDLERVSYGFAERTPAEKQTMAEAWVRAKEAPADAARTLAKQIESNPKRGLTGDESALLLRHKVDLENALNRAAERTITEQDPALKSEAMSDVDRLRGELESFLDAIAKRGNEWGREGRWRQALAYEDYTFATQERLLRASKGGEELTRGTPDSEYETLVRDVAEHKAKAEALEARLKQQEEKAAAADAARMLAEAKAAYDPRVLGIAERFAGFMDKRASDAATRLREKLRNVGAGVDPTIVIDLAEIAAAKITRGAVDFSKWSAEAIRDFGDVVKPFLQKAWDDAKANVAKDVEKWAKTLDKNTVEKVKKQIIKPDKAAKHQKVIDALKESQAEGLADGELGKYVKEIVAQVVDSGVTEYDAIWDATKKILDDAGVVLEKRDIIQAYSDYGKSIAAPTDPVKVRLAQLRGEAQKALGLEDVIKKRQPPQATGPRRVKVSDLYRRTVAKIHEAMRDLGIVAKDPERQLADALQSRKTYRQNRIKDLRHELATGQRIVKGKSVPIEDAELKALDAEYQALKQEHGERFPKAELTQEQQIAAANRGLDREIAALEEQIRTKNVLPESNRPPISTPELEAKRARLEALREQRNELRDLNEEFQRQKAEDALKREKQNLLDQIEEAQRKLKEGDLASQRQPINRPASPEIEVLKQQRDALNKQLAEARKKPAEVKAAEQMQRRVDAMNERIADLEAKVAARDVSTKSAPVNRPLPPELEKAKQRIDALNKQLAEIRNPKKTREEMALSAMKARTRARIADIQDRLARSDFSKKIKPEPVKPDAEAYRLKLELKAIEQKLAEARLRNEKANRTFGEWAQDTFVDWARGVKLLSPYVFPKLVAAGITRLTTNPIYRLAGQPLRLIPGLASKAPGELRMSLKAEASAVAAILKSPPQVWKKLIKGKSNLDVLEGKISGSREMSGLIGNSHGMVKEPVRQAAFARSIELNTQEAIRQGLNPREPAVAATIESSALADARREIFMNENMITKALVRIPIEYLRRSGKTGAKTIANVIEFLLPIVNVPTNITIASARLNPVIGFGEAMLRLAKAAKEGELANRSVKLSEADAQSIARAFKYGGIGTFLAAYAWLNPDQFGGVFDEKGKKRKLKPYQIEIMGIKTPKWLGHAPELAFLNTVAAARRVYDRYYASEGKTGAAINALAFSLMAPVKNLPFIDQYLRLFSTYQSPGQTAGAMIRDATLPTSQIMKLLDDQERQPKTFWQEIEMGIPGLRSEVPRKSSTKTNATKVPLAP